MQTVPLSEAKDRLSALVEDIQSTHEAVTITRHGRPAVVMMAVDDLESLQETLFWLSQPGIKDDLAEAEQEIAEAGGMTVDQLRDQLRAKRP
jgi:antitoxin YefM